MISTLADFAAPSEELGDVLTQAVYGAVFKWIQMILPRADEFAPKPDDVSATTARLTEGLAALQILSPELAEMARAEIRARVQESKEQTSGIDSIPGR